MDCFQKLITAVSIISCKGILAKDYRHQMKLKNFNYHDHIQMNLIKNSFVKDYYEVR